MSNLDKLITHFERFPGVGGRQARRFAFHLLTQNEADNSEIAKLIENLKSSVSECHRCHRFYAAQSSSDIHCSICSDSNRDQSKLMIVERDSDVQSIERAGAYEGLYFVLGGTVPLLDKKDSPSLRGNTLKKQMSDFVESGINELILAFSVNPDGENTERYITTVLKDIIDEYKLKVSVLGRGLSTGSELEYADPETIKNALHNRTQ